MSFPEPSKNPNGDSPRERLVCGSNASNRHHNYTKCGRKVFVSCGHSQISSSTNKLCQNHKLIRLVVPEEPKECKSIKFLLMFAMRDSAFDQFSIVCSEIHILVAGFGRLASNEAVVGNLFYHSMDHIFFFCFRLPNICLIRPKSFAPWFHMRPASGHPNGVFCDLRQWRDRCDNYRRSKRSPWVTVL